MLSSLRVITTEMGFRWRARRISCGRMYIVWRAPRNDESKRLDGQHSVARDDLPFACYFPILDHISATVQRTSRANVDGDSEHSIAGTEAVGRRRLDHQVFLI